MKVFDLRTSSYLESVMVTIGVGILIGGITVIFRSLPAGIIMIVLSAVIFSIHKRIRIDPAGRRYKEYVWFLGMALGATRKMEAIHSIQIRRVRLSQTVHSLNASSTVRKSVYEGYLRFTDGEKVLVARKEEKGDLIEILKPLAAALNETVIDLSDGNPRIV